jgi:hypothetical protein
MGKMLSLQPKLANGTTLWTALGLRFDDWVSEVEPSSVVVLAFRSFDCQKPYLTGSYCSRLKFSPQGVLVGGFV